MGLDLWFKEDVIRILNQAVASGVDSRNAPIYDPDYFKAIEVIAIGFGLKVGIPENIPRLIDHND